MHPTKPGAEENAVMTPPVRRDLPTYRELRVRATWLRIPPLPAMAIVTHLVTRSLVSLVSWAIAYENTAQPVATCGV